MLIAFGGLPGTGKTTLARALARETGAVYLRIDTIEQTLRAAGRVADDIGPAGYLVAYAMAKDNLIQGKTVVADSVNPIALTRNAWRAIAADAGVPSIEIEVVCSDAVEHRRRVETRETDITGLDLPTWQQVIDREYEPWNMPHLTVDTARLRPEAALAEIYRYLTG